MRKLVFPLLMVSNGTALAASINTSTASIPDNWAGPHTTAVNWSIVVVFNVVATFFEVRYRHLSSEQSDDAKIGQNQNRSDNPPVVGGDNSGIIVTGDSGPVLGHVEHAHFHSQPRGESQGKDRGADDEQVTNVPIPAPAIRRDRELDSIGSRISNAAPAVLTIQGLGGSGKSTLAQRFAYEQRLNGTYRVTWWIDASTELTIRRSLAALAPKLGTPTEQAEAATISAVLAQLSQTRDWLLIYDNASNPDDIRPWLPSGEGHVLITSRERGWGGLGQWFEPGNFTSEESVSLIRIRTGKDEPEAAAQLANLLDHLPLAMAQAAAYLEIHNSMSVKACVEIVQDRQSVAELLTHGLPDSEYPKSVATTWLLHFDDLRRDNPAALELLALFSFLAPSDIPADELLVKTRHIPESLGNALETPAEKRHVVSALTRTHLVSPVGENALKVHRLVQAVVRHHLPEETEQDWENLAASHINSFLAISQLETLPLSARMAPHVQRAAEHTTYDYVKIRFLHWLGWYSWQKVEIAAAIDYYTQALTVAKKVYAPNHPNILQLLVGLGVTHRQVGNLDAAHEHLTGALAITKMTPAHPETPKHPDVDGHPDTVHVLIQLSGIHLARLEGSAALENLKEALTIAESSTSHPDTAHVLTELGATHLAMNDPRSALKVLARALNTTKKTRAVTEDSPGGIHATPSDIQAAHIQGHLGVAHLMLGNAVTGQKRLERAVATLEESHKHTPNHPDIAELLVWLGGAHVQLEDNATARRHFDRARAMLHENPNLPITPMARHLLDMLAARAPSTPQRDA